ncbi:MAG: LysM peptidoglycan-binding domain-containing protein, partial [Burkholderiales bacterium]
MMVTTSSLKAGVLLLAINLLAGGCANELRPAQVIDKSPAARQAAKPAKEKIVAKQEGGARPEFYIVQKGDTLYSIALAHDLDYKDVAQWNNISDPALISEGQQLRLTPSPDVAVTAPLQTTPGVEGKPVESLEARPLPPSGMVKTEPKA